MSKDNDFQNSLVRLRELYSKGYPLRPDDIAVSQELQIDAEKIIQLCQEGKIHKSIDSLFQQVDDCLLAGKFETVDHFLANLDISRLDLNVLIGVLSITWMASPKLRHYQEFFGKVRQFILSTETDPDRIADLTRGLEGSPFEGEESI